MPVLKPKKTAERAPGKLSGLLTHLGFPHDLSLVSVKYRLSPSTEKEEENSI
jgi:hypothetical protein